MPTTVDIPVKAARQLLKICEDGEGNVRVEIKAARSIAVYGYVAVNVLFMSACVFLMEHLRAVHPDVAALTFRARVVEVFGILGTGLVFAIVFTGKQAVWANASFIEVKKYLAGITLMRCVLDNCSVRNMSYVHWKNEGRDRNVQYSGIRIESESRQILLGLFLSSKQASEIFDALSTVHDYPRTQMK